MRDEILQPVRDADIPKLIEIYKSQLPKASYIYNYLHCVLRWRQQHLDSRDIRLMAPNGNFSNGTFVAIHEFPGYELFMFTLENDCQVMCDALLNTKLINWNRSLLLYAVHEDHFPAIKETLEKTTHRFYRRNICGVWWMPKEKALQLEITCPPEVYVEKLKPAQAALIDSHWSYRYLDSEKYVANVVEECGGYGVFLKSNGELVAWVLRNFIGMGALQTVDKHKRKGYGGLVTKVLAKELARDGFDPLGTVFESNEASKAMFQKLGFEVLEKVVYIENEEMRIY